MLRSFSRSLRLTLSSSTWACRMCKAWMRYEGRARPHQVFRLWCFRAWTTSQWRCRPCRKALKTTSSRARSKPRELVRALRYAVERKVIEETLFEEKERAQVTLDSIGDAVICTDVSGNITFLNIIAERMTGWPLREVSGRLMTDAFRIVNASTRKAVPNPMVLEL
jgi:PAS domain-containing protein